MGAPEGFTWARRKNGDVVISHHRRVATTLRGRRAEAFVDEVGGIGDVDAQELMARVTGNYKHGNERQSAEHERHRGRR